MLTLQRFRSSGVQGKKKLNRTLNPLDSWNTKALGAIIYILGSKIYI